MIIKAGSYAITPLTNRKERRWKDTFKEHEDGSFSQTITFKPEEVDPNQESLFGKIVRGPKYCNCISICEEYESALVVCQMIGKR